MSKDTISVNMNVYDIPIVVEQLKKLELENKQLKEQLEYLRSNEYLNQVKWERNFNEDLVKDLQQRIDKAIEKVKDIWFTLSGDKFYVKVILKDTESGKKLLEILGDKENE